MGFSSGAVSFSDVSFFVFVTAVGFLVLVVLGFSGTEFSCSESITSSSTGIVISPVVDKAFLGVFTEFRVTFVAVFFQKLFVAGETIEAISEAKFGAIVEPSLLTK